MFDALTRQPDDPLLALIGLYRKDERPGKVDLGVGVYRDETGHTPIFRAVKEAEKRLLATQDSKAYVGPEGDLIFVDHLWTLVGGDTINRSHLAGVQTPGGSGALRLAADLIRQMGGKRIWIGLPSWPNHASIFKAAGLETAGYPFFDVPSQTVLFDTMMSALQGASAGDAVLLHAGCHNPTGGVITDTQWLEIAAVVAERGLLPLIDLAYQGFGRGLDEDVTGLRHLIGIVPETLIAVSCSKSFGLYRERTGAIFAVTASSSSADTVRSTSPAWRAPATRCRRITAPPSCAPSCAMPTWRATGEKNLKLCASVYQAFADRLPKACATAGRRLAPSPTRKACSRCCRFRKRM